MTFLALIAIIFFGFAVYNLTCAFVDIPTKKTSQMMIRSSPASLKRLKVCSPKHQIRGQFAELLQLAPFLFADND